jgi:WD40 repeat protein
LPEYSDDNPIAVAKFSNKRFEIYVAGEQSVKIWDARSGRPVRVLKNVFATDDTNTEGEEGTKKASSEITTMEFDEHHRKLIIGDSLGHIKVFDILSGV